MRLYSLILLCVVVFWSLPTYSFNAKHCRDQLFVPVTSRVPPSPVTWLLITTIAPTSTSQFVSSSGSCSAVAETEFQKKYFIAQNLEPLKIDSARGRGEYLSAYLSLSGCSGNARKEYSRFLQNNFTKIYGEKLDNSSLQVYERLEWLIKNDENLKKFAVFQVNESFQKTQFISKRNPNLQHGYIKKKFESLTQLGWNY